jgi:hypothetical protein
MQQFQSQDIPFSTNDTPSGFISNDASPSFNFSDMLEVEDQANQPWQGVQMSQRQALICEYCIDTGFILSNSKMEPCYLCRRAFR